MAARFELINDILPLSGASNDFTISGFGTPDAAIIIVSGGTTDSTAASNCILGIGVVDDSADASIGFSVQDAVSGGFSLTNRMVWNSGIAIPDPDTTATSDGIIECSLVTDGIRLNVTTAPTSAFRFTALLIGGADVTQAEVIVQDDLGNAPGDVAISLSDTWSAAPSLAFGFTQDGNTPPNAVQANGIVSLGFSNFTDHAQVAVGTFDNTNGFYSTNSISNTFMLSQTFGGAIAWQGYPHTPTTTDFQFNMSAAGGNDVAVFLVVGLAVGFSATVFDFSVSADPGGDDTPEPVTIVTEQDDTTFAFVVTNENISAFDTATGSQDTGLGIVQYDGTTVSAISFAFTDIATNLAASQHSDAIEILDSDTLDDAIVATPSFSGFNYTWAMTEAPDGNVLGVGFAIGTDDNTAAVLSLPTGAESGHITGTGTVTIDDNVGTLFYYASINASETAATIKTSGSQQVVTQTGIQNVTFTNLLPETLYYAHYVHEDLAYTPNQSNKVDSSPGFTTDPDPEPRFEIVNGTLPTSGTANFTITGFGTPNAALLIVSGAVFDVTAEDHTLIGIGVMDDTTQGSVAFTARDTATSATHKSLYTALAAGPIADSATPTLDFDINGTFITDGVQLSIVNAPAAELRCTMMLMGGTGVTIAEVIIKDDLGAASGDITVDLSKVWTAPPNLLFGITGNSSTAADSLESDGMLSFGFSNFTSHGSISFGGEDATSGEYMTAMTSNTMMLSQTFNGSVSWQGEPHTATVDDFKFNMSASGGNDIAIFLAIRLANGYSASVNSIAVEPDQDLTIAPSLTQVLSNMVITLQGPITYGNAVSTDDIAAGIVMYDDYNISAISASVSDSSAKSQHSNSLVLLDGNGSDDLVAGIPMFNESNIEWATSIRPSSSLLGMALSIGTSVPPLAEISGTATNVDWKVIRDLGGTIIITLTVDTFIAAGTGPIGTLAQSDAFVQSFVAATSPTNGWNNEISLDNTDLVRTSDTIATITVPATGTYNPLQTEILQGVVQAAILTTSIIDTDTAVFQITVGNLVQNITSDITSDIVRDLI